MEKYRRINNLTGLAIFFFASFVYWLCMEPTLSFWDCGEFIAASFKMQVGHQPGAPLFLMIGKLFSVLAGTDVTKVAYWVNFVSVVSSGATIMFLFWTINAIALKLIKPENGKMNGTQLFTVIAAGTVGALAYTFSDTFWFSAVEAEVYAISTLCTAILGGFEMGSAHERQMAIVHCLYYWAFDWHASFESFDYSVDQFAVLF